MLQEKSASLNITNCSNNWKQSLLTSSFIFFLHCCNLFLKAKTIAASIKMRMLHLFKDVFKSNAFKFSKI